VADRTAGPVRDVVLADAGPVVVARSPRHQGRVGGVTKMSDANDAAWRVHPADYVARRLIDFVVAQPCSQYVTMHDGCRLAIDAYVPQSKAGTGAPQRFPTLLFLTPYYRRFKLKPGGSGEVNPNTGKFR